jgi:hypothetical protein
MGERAPFVLRYLRTNGYGPVETMIMANEPKSSLGNISDLPHRRYARS